MKSITLNMLYIFSILCFSVVVGAKEYQFDIDDIHLVSDQINQYVKPSQLLPKTGSFMIISDGEKQVMLHKDLPTTDKFREIFDGNRGGGKIIILDVEHGVNLKSVSLSQ
jgi:hypothetical protein